LSGFSSTFDDPFRYADHICNFLSKFDKFLVWQVLWHLEGRREPKEFLSIRVFPGEDYRVKTN
jgi:hypothetical protein